MNERLFTECNFLTSLVAAALSVIGTYITLDIAVMTAMQLHMGSTVARKSVLCTLWIARSADWVRNPWIVAQSVDPRFVQGLKL